MQEEKLPEYFFGPKRLHACRGKIAKSDAGAYNVLGISQKESVFA